MTTTVRPSDSAASPPPDARPDAPPDSSPDSPAESSQAERKPVTLRTIAKYVERDEPFACLTCYDYTTAQWLERAGIPVLLIGDTAAEMILGLPGTIHAPLDFLLMLTAAVKRGAPKTLVMGDMPFMSYQADEAEGVRNAGRFLTEGNADIVKLEVERSFADLVTKITRAGIPVCAHLGTRPQTVKMHGGYKSTGRTAAEAQRLVEDAIIMEQAGASLLLIEAVPNEVSRRIVQKTSIPLIGCGGGPACHGQIVVLQDLLGLSSWQPSFARPLANLGGHVIEAAQTWIEKVRAADLGQHPYTMKEKELDKF